MVSRDELGMDDERLRRRILFLNERAQAHLGQDGAKSREERDRTRREMSQDGAEPREEQDRTRREMSIACAGRLLRDAAATAILVQEYDQAKALLTRAGALWASIGLFSGYALLSLGQPQAWWSNRPEDMYQVRGELSREVNSEVDRKTPESRELPPMMAGSVGSMRQLLHLYQSVQPHLGQRDYIADDDIAASVAGMARGRLLEQSTVQVGLTEVPMRSYVHLFDAAVSGKFDPTARETLSGMVMRRAEQLSAASADTYHWRLALAPVALVDFDLMALAIASADARNTIAGVAEHFAERNDAVKLPLAAAQGLRPKEARSDYYQ